MNPTVCAEPRNDFTAATYLLTVEQLLARPGIGAQRREAMIEAAVRHRGVMLVEESQVRQWRPMSAAAGKMEASA